MLRPASARPLAAAAALAAVALALAMVAGAHAQPTTDVPWKCRVCEDVVQTWHDQFPCAGGFLDWGDPTNPDIPGCKGPEFKCNSLGGQLRDACLSFQKELSVSSPTLGRKVWETMMMQGDAYKACLDIGKCEADPTYEDTDPKKWSPCLSAWRNASTGARPYDKAYSEVCSETCYLCLWSVKYWPLFGETCKPEGATLPQSVPLPGDAPASKPAALFAELASRTSASASRSRSGLSYRGDDAEERFAESLQRSRMAALARARARAREQAYAEARLERAEESMRLGIPQAAPSKDAEQTQLQTGYTLPQTCFEMWNEVERSPRARYFVSWKNYVSVMANSLDRLGGRMWDANVVCKCLGHCDVSRFEDLGLLEACRYGDAEEQMMDYLFKEEGKIVQYTEV